MCVVVASMDTYFFLGSGLDPENTQKSYQSSISTDFKRQVVGTQMRYWCVNFAPKSTFVLYFLDDYMIKTNRIFTKIH